MNPRLPLILKWLFFPVTGGLYLLSFLLLILFVVFTPPLIAAAGYYLFWGSYHLGTYLLGDSIISGMIGLAPIFIAIRFGVILQRRGDFDFAAMFENAYMKISEIFDVFIDWLREQFPF